jgi:hypothetical protein
VPLAVGIVFGAMTAGVLFGDPAWHPFARLSEEEAADELARSFLGYLESERSFGEAARPPSS